MPNTFFFNNRWMTADQVRHFKTKQKEQTEEVKVETVEKVETKQGV